MAHDINETAIGFLPAQGCKLLHVAKEQHVDGIVDKDANYAILYPNGEVKIPYCQRYKSVEDWAVSNDLSLLPWPNKPLSKDRYYHGAD